MTTLEPEPATRVQHHNERRTGWAYGIMVSLVLAIGVGSMLYASRHWWLPPVASAHGAKIDRLFNTLLAVTGVTFVLVHGLLALFIVRYSARGEARAAYWHDNRVLELAWTLIPAAVLGTLTLMGGMVWAGMQGAVPVTAGGEDTTVVEVTAQQFVWIIRYPGEDGRFGSLNPKLASRENPLGLDRSDPAGRDDIVSFELVLPVDRTVTILLHSKDVIHSFFVPNFRVKQDAVPGRTTRVEVHTTKLGSYEIACAELCGTGHYGMRSTLRVVTAQEFDAWLKEQAGNQ